MFQADRWVAVEMRGSRVLDIVAVLSYLAGGILIAPCIGQMVKKSPVKHTAGRAGRSMLYLVHTYGVKKPAQDRE